MCRIRFNLNISHDREGYIMEHTNGSVILKAILISSNKEFVIGLLRINGIMYKKRKTLEDRLKVPSSLVGEILSGSSDDNVNLDI